jgi:hypothetical protein
MRSLSQQAFFVAVRRLLANRNRGPSAASLARPETKLGRWRGPSTIVMRRELESFRRAQGAAYWHHDRRAD